MKILSCKTPVMAVKEIRVCLLACNLIRLMMAQAAVLADCLPRQISFKHSLQMWNAWDRCRIVAANNASMDDLFALIVQQKVGDRPGRVEPRALTLSQARV